MYVNWEVRYVLAFWNKSPGDFWTRKLRVITFLLNVRLLKEIDYTLQNS